MEGRRIIDRMVQEGRIERADVDRQALQAQRTNENLVDLVIDAGVLPEAEFLKYAANLYRTQFVGTEKLIRAPIERAVLEMVPIRLVERFGALPLLLDRRTQSLAVVVADLDQLDVDKQIAIAAQVRTVNLYVARPRTVRALIRRWYYGDSKPVQAILDSLRAPAPSSSSAAKSGGSPGIDLAGFGAVDDDDFAAPPPPPKPAAAPISIDFGGPKPAATSASSDFEDIPGLSTATPAPAPKPAPSPVQLPAFSLPAFSLDGGGASAKREARDEAESVAPPPPEKRVEGEPTPEGMLELASVLVALLEQSREELRGHSSQVARLAKRVAERVGVDDATIRCIVLAAHLHDVGKASNYHLTPLNVSQYEGHRLQATKSYLAPVRLLESAKLPRAVVDALTHLYERFDGTGFPERQTGRDIPLGSRILAVVESYVDITTNSKNPFRKVLSAKEACEALAKSRGAAFDPTIVDLVRLLVIGEDLDRKLDADRRRILIVDPDPEESTVLEIRLAEHGFDTVVVRDAEGATKKLTDAIFDLAVVEVELPGTDGFRFLQRLKSGSQPDMPLLVLTKRADRESVERGFALGVADYLIKPASADVVAAKIRLALDTVRPATPAAKVKGVSGQLSDMPLPDVVQILANGRRSGKLTVKSDGTSGELHFRDGFIFDANFGNAAAAEAVYAMLALIDGDFVLDSSFVPEENKINQSCESLLLEGMRRLDELRR